MRGRHLLALGTLLAVTFGFGARAPLQTNEERNGLAAEQAGKLRDALAHYVAALQSTADGSDEVQGLRERIIKLVLKLDPAPVEPEEALRSMARGKAAVELAKKPEDYRLPIAEFQKAVRSAPWLAGGYFNLGVVQERAEQYADAIRSFRFYLLAAPSAPDAKEVQAKIYSLEYIIERKEAEERAPKEWLKSMKEKSPLWDVISPTSECGNSDTQVDDHFSTSFVVDAGNDFALRGIKTCGLPGGRVLMRKDIEIAMSGRKLRATVEGVFMTTIGADFEVIYKCPGTDGWFEFRAHGTGLISEDFKEIKLTLRPRWRFRDCRLERVDEEYTMVLRD